MATRKEGIEGAGGWRFSTYNQKGRIYSRARRRRSDGEREQVHLGPIHLETWKMRGCFVVRIIIGRQQRRNLSLRQVTLRANLVSFWGDALIERNGWKSGNQVEIVIGSDHIVADPLIEILRERIVRYNEDQRYLAWKWEGTYGAGRRQRLLFKQCVTCEKRSREERLERDVRAGRMLRPGQAQLQLGT